jgi:hypothetical protein
MSGSLREKLRHAVEWTLKCVEKGFKLAFAKLMLALQAENTFKS